MMMKSAAVAYADSDDPKHKAEFQRWKVRHETAETIRAEFPRIMRFLSDAEVKALREATRIR